MSSLSSIGCWRDYTTLNREILKVREGVIHGNLFSIFSVFLAVLVTWFFRGFSLLLCCLLIIVSYTVSRIRKHSLTSQPFIKTYNEFSWPMITPNPGMENLLLEVLMKDGPIKYSYAGEKGLDLTYPLFCASLNIERLQPFVKKNNDCQYLSLSQTAIQPSLKHKLLSLGFNRVFSWRGEGWHTLDIRGL